jgi:hypothetical protein
VSLTPEELAVMDQAPDAWIQTYGGRQFRFLAPTEDQLHLEDIVFPLSRNQRYGGHALLDNYSVLEHSCLVSNWVYAETGDPVAALQGLAHDFSEGYLVDIPRPIKAPLGGYYAIERPVQRCIYRWLDLPEDMLPIVREADERILVDERAQIMRPTDHAWQTDSLRPLGVTIVGVAPWQARGMFHDTFKRLMGLAGRDASKYITGGCGTRRR